MIIATGSRISLALAFALSVTILSQMSVGARAWAGPVEVADELLVGFHAGVDDADAEDAYRGIGGALIERLDRLRVHRIRVAPAALEAMERALASRPDVRFVERNRLVPVALLSNDPYGTSWHLAKIDAPLAWDLVLGSTSIIIAILDTGVDGDHPDLQSKLVAGTNVATSASPTVDAHGHGTLVAGIAVAATNNLLGVAGICWKCKLMPVRITDSSGYASYSAMAQGLTWAADHGARVMNLSFSNVAESSTVRTAAQYVQSRSGVVVAAAGNCGCLDSTPDNPYVLSVSATTSSDTIASFSSRGNYVDVSAPGDYVWTTRNDGTYTQASGTSLASPVVAGVIGLMLSANPALTPTQVETLLQANADDRGSTGYDSSYGWGRVNAFRAVAAAVASLPVDTTAPTVSISAPAAGAVVSGTVTVNVSASDNVAVTRVDLYVDGALLASDALAPHTFSWTTTGLTNGLHTLTTHAVDAAGNVGTSAARTVDVENLPPAGEIILDNAAAGVQDPAGGRTFTGTWCKSAAAGAYGADSLYSCGTALDTYRWTPTIPAARSYDVYVRWTMNTNRGTAVPIKVRYAGGETTRAYNEQASGGQWVLHGRYSFNAGTGGWVETSDSAGQGAADAVRFVPAP